MQIRKREMLLLLEKPFGVNWAFAQDASQPLEMFQVCVLFLLSVAI